MTHRVTVRMALLALLVLTTPGAGQDMPESSPEALMHYARGVERYVQGANEEAAAHLLQAFEADPSFYVALLMAGVAYGNLGRGDRADSLYALVAPHRHRLSPYYRARLDAQLASRRGDVARAADLMRTLSWGAPGTKAGYNLALWTSALNRPREALRALQSLNPDREPMRGWLSYFTVFSGAAHAVGELEEELVMARKARTQFPDIRAANLEALALASLGRTTELDALLDQIATMPAVGTLDPGDVMVNAGLELAAHGAGADARRHAERAVAWYDARPEEEARTPDARSGKAYALYTLARYREAAALYGALAREAPANGTYQAWTGILAGLAGDKRTAAEVAGRFEAGEIQVTPANRAIWRGLIAAAVGERERAVALLRESGVRARWMHRDPMLRATILEHPAFAGYLAPEG